MSSFSLPQGKQPLLQVKGQQISTAICYEIAYPELVRSGARQADILLTVSNDTWFGRSIAPAQHMQIARVRALENGRWLIRGTNNGISGLINPQGNWSPDYPSSAPVFCVERSTRCTEKHPSSNTALLRYSAPLCSCACLVWDGGDHATRFLS